MASAAKDLWLDGGNALSLSEAYPAERLVAFEVRPNRIGFVVFEGATRLLDWGVRIYGKQDGSAVLAGKKAASLLDLYSPSVLVIRQRKDVSMQVAEKLRTIIRRISAEARLRSINFRKNTPTAIQRFFKQYGCATKHEIATTLAGWFEELSWKLPPKRRAWDSEHSSAVIFDAAAAAVAFIASSEGSAFLQHRFDGPSPGE